MREQVTAEAHAMRLYYGIVYRTIVPHERVQLLLYTYGYNPPVSIPSHFVLLKRKVAKFLQAKNKAQKTPYIMSVKDKKDIFYSTNDLPLHFPPKDGLLQGIDCKETQKN